MRKSVYLICNENNTKMEQKTIKIADLEVNRGQIDGLPKNPRTIKDARFEALKKSIEDAPEMLALRELLVFPHNGKFVVIGGNMRLKACKELGYKELPCKVIDENTPVEKLREYTIKDNIGFGADDWGALFEDWNTDELADWGLEFPEDLSGEDVNADDYGDSFALKDGEKGFATMSFQLSNDQAMKIQNAVKDAKNLEEYKYIETFGNTNTNGNALYLIISQWEDARK